MPTVIFKRNDTNLKFTDTILVNGLAADLTNSTVSFVLRDQSSGVAVKKTATVVGAMLGTVEYAPVIGDVSKAGTFSQEWEVVWQNGKQLTIPSSGYNTVVIDPDLG